MSEDGEADPSRVVLDACTLVPIRLATTLLWLAEDGLFEPLWSEEILDEVERTLPKIGISAAKASRRVEAFSSFPFTLVRIDDGTWRVHSLGSSIPAAGEAWGSRAGRGSD